jgi:hypothetical protein
MNTWEELFNNIRVNTKNKNHQYLHAIVWGFDAPNWVLEETPTLTLDTEYTTYQALVRDKTKFDSNSTLKDSLTGKNISDVVEKFSTTSVEEAYKFFKKYND